MSTGSGSLELGAVAMKAIASMERASMVSLSLHGLLQSKGEEALARLAWLAFQESSETAETLGQSLGVEVTVG